MLRVLAGFSVGLGLRDLAGIDNRRAAFALADMAAEFERLLESHPDRRGKAARRGGRPEDEDIDALVGDAVRAQRPRDGPAACSALQGWCHGRTPFSSWATIWPVMRV